MVDQEKITMFNQHTMTPNLLYAYTDDFKLKAFAKTVLLFEFRSAILCRSVLSSGRTAGASIVIRWIPARRNSFTRVMYIPSRCFPMRLCSHRRAERIRFRSATVRFRRSMIPLRKMQRNPRKGIMAGDLEFACHCCI